MEQVKRSLKAFRSVLLLSTFLVCFGSAAFAHRVETFTTTGCTQGANVTVDAVIVAAGSSTWYAWQYKDATGIWKCFQSSNTINGVTFTATGFASAGPANDAPQLVINNATSALDNVLIRVLMRDNATPCGAPAGTTYGGDDLALNETKYLRLHIYTAVGDCGGTTPGCIGNIIQTGTLGTQYYGGFENKIYNVATDAYTDLNFAAGAGSSDFSEGTSAGRYQIINNPYGANSTFTRNIAPHSGNFQMVVFGNTTASARAWYKTVTVVPGSSYHFSAWVARVNNTDPNIALRVNNVELNNVNLSTVTVGNWIQVSATYVVPAGTTSITISIGDKNAATGANNYTIDDICFRLLGSIGDVVFNDANKDGIKNNGEVGIAGVTVSLLDANGKIISSTVTDALGSYLFNGLSTSVTGVAYSVDFGLPAGYQFTAKGTLTTDNNSDADLVTGKTGTITLTSAAPNVTYVDAGAYYTTQTIIGDRVWNDLDKDGIQDAGEPGIAGVTVMLYKSDNTFVGATVTDNNGNYSFSDLPAASYYLKVAPPTGYVLSARNTTNNSGTATDSDFGVTDFKSSVFTTTATTTNLDWDAGMYVATLRSALGDRVWNDLNGDNLQTAGEPGVAGVTVQLYNKTTNALLQTAVTDAFGYYNFNGLSGGTYYIKFTLPSGYTFVTGKTGSDDNVDSDVNGTNGAGTTANIILLDNQIRMYYDAGIKSTTANLTSLGDFVWYDLNKDGLQTAGEPGMPGITVKLYSTANVLLQTTSTDNTGFYKFTGLTVGTQYIVAFSNIPAGYAFTTAKVGADNTIDSDVQPTTGRTAAVTATAQAAAVTTVDAGIILAPSVFPSKGSVGDFVWNDINNNGIQDAGEPGIAGVTVKLYDGNTSTVIATTTTDALGKYIFTNLPAGTYSVEFSGYPAEYVFSTQNAGTDKTKDSDPASSGRTAVFTLAAGEINITIDAGLRNPTTLSSIGNQVWNDLNGNGLLDAGEPGISGVSVYLYDENQNLLANTVTDENGNYLFTDLKADTYSLGFGNIPAGFTATTRTAAAASDNDSDPNVVSFVTNQFTLAAGTTDLKWDLGLKSTTYGSIGDRVWNDLDRDGVQDAGEPGVPGILVTLYNSAGTAIASTVTNGLGNYIFKNIIAGTYSVGFSTLPGESGFTVKSSAAGTTATDSDADPATGKTATFTLAGGQNKTDIDAGLVSLFASVGDYVWRDANIDGLQSANEKGYAGMTLTLYTSAGVPVTSAVSDGKGFYFINNIPVAAAGSSFYMVLTGLLPNSLMTTKYKNGTNLNTANNNDFSSVSGVIRTDVFTLLPGENNPNVDAGIVAPDPTVVAISGLQLSAVLNNNITDLKWYTEAEVSNDHFEIERSIDGVHYESAGTKAAAGFSTSRTDYTSTDAIGTLSSKAVIYYRIKAYGIDGSFVYSNVVTVRPGKSATIEIWPNPFAEQISIKVTSAARSQASVVITDSKGMTVKKSTIILSAGANFVTYTDLASLAKGAYTIRIVQDNETLISQVIVKN